MVDKFCYCLSNIRGSLIVSVISGIGKIIVVITLCLIHDWSNISATFEDIFRIIVILCLTVSVVFDLVLLIGSLIKSRGCYVSWLAFSVLNLIGSMHMLLYGKFWLWALGILALVCQVWFLLIVIGAFREIEDINLVAPIEVLPPPIIED